MDGRAPVGSRSGPLVAPGSEAEQGTAADERERARASERERDWDWD